MDAAFFQLALIVLGLLAVQLGTLPGARRPPRRSVAPDPARDAEARSGAAHAITH